jgi:hypothetical protein
MLSVTAQVTIERRFNGPPDSANGGCACGLLARELGGPAEVTLRRPPPLERPLAIRRLEGDRVGLLDGDELVAEAAPAEVEDPPHPPVSLDDAAAGPEGFPFFGRHPFPTCFVCGPHRAPGDGLRIFPGPVAGGEVFAAPWTPDDSLGPAGSALAPELVWAGLDCPTSTPVANRAQPGGTQRPIVLARLAARIAGPVEVGRPHVVTAWPVLIDGRKRQAGSALYTADGELRAVARALWIELRG